MIIRPYRPDDFERLYRIDQAAFPPALAYSRAELRYYVTAHRGRTLVAEAEAAAAEAAAAAGAAGTAGAAGIAGAAESGPGDLQTPRREPPVGFVIGRGTHRGWGTIITLDVDPAWQRRGVGSRLLAAIEDWLRGEGVRVVSLETPADESGARRFYERNGYQLGGRVRGYYHGRLDAFGMVKRLVDPGAAGS